MWYWQPSIIYCLPRFRWRPTSLKWVQLQILSLHNKISVLYCICKRSIQKRIKSLILAGLEPAIPWFVVRCLIHWATGPHTIYSFFPAIAFRRSATRNATYIDGINLMLSQYEYCLKRKQAERFVHQRIMSSWKSESSLSGHFRKEDKI